MTTFVIGEVNKRIMKRIKGINGFKGIAAFVIIFYHFWANKSGDFQRGYLAVDFFL